MNRVSVKNYKASVNYFPINDYLFLLNLLEKVENLNDFDSLLNELKQLKPAHELDLIIYKDFLVFLDDLKSKKYGKQRNNHNYMRTFIAERCPYYVYLNFENLEYSLLKNKLPISNNIPTKKILSNYLITNKSEDDLQINRLEETYRRFTRSERATLKDSNFVVELKGMYFPIHFDDRIYEDEIIHIRDYFCLQLSRSENVFEEFFPYFALNSKEDIENMSLLKYLMFKYVCNKVFLYSFNVWRDIIGEKNLTIQQVLFLKSEEKIIWGDFNEMDFKSDNFKKIKNEAKSRHLVLSEYHTLPLNCLFKKSFLLTCKPIFKANKIQFFTKDELKKLKRIWMTHGESGKICFLTNLDNFNQGFLNKINFCIQSFADELLLLNCTRDCLIEKDSDLLKDLSFFKKMINGNKLKSKLLFTNFKRISDLWEDEINK